MKCPNCGKRIGLVSFTGNPFDDTNIPRYPSCQGQTIIDSPWKGDVWHGVIGPNGRDTSPVYNDSSLRW